MQQYRQDPPAARRAVPSKEIKTEHQSKKNELEAKMREL